jgi:hypothetical protein
MTRQTHRDPSRAALAEAIATASEAQRELQAAEDAALMARDRLWEAKRKLEEIREAKADESSASHFAASFIASVAAGAPCDVLTLEDPATASRANEETAAHEVDVWKRTRESCNAAVPVREENLKRAKRSVEAAARDVIRNSDAATKLMAGLEELQSELVRRRVALRFLVYGDFLAEREAIQSFLRNKDLPGGFGSFEVTEWDRHSAHVAWQQAFEALLHDADAPLPTGS